MDDRSGRATERREDGGKLKAPRTSVGWERRDGGVSRRQFLRDSLAGLGTLSLGGGFLAGPGGASAAEGIVAAARPVYRGAHVVIIRYGGGARRRESIDETHTWSPFLRHELTRRGTLFPLMEIASNQGVETGHGQGTLNILTGAYGAYRDVNHRLLGERFEPVAPTLFEYLRKSFAIPEHQALIINGEDRIDEEFYAFSNHHLFGVGYRSNVLSLYRFKTHLLRRRLEQGGQSAEERRRMKAELGKMESLDGRVDTRAPQSKAMEGFWDRWRDYYGEDGLRNPRGDRLLTELALRAMRQLHPRLMMIHYQDCDYVHWGNLNHYTRGIQIMDQGIRQIVEFADRDERYRDNTVFVIVPDCGRDASPLRAVPCQHHFTRASREIFALLLGPGIGRGKVVDRHAEQIDIAPTVAAIMGFNSAHTEGRVLEEAFA